MTFPEPIDFSWLQAPALKEITHVPVALGTNNLGDDIQSLAAMQTLGVTAHVRRDRPKEWPADAVVAMCGWYGWGFFPSPARVIVIGFHCTEAKRSNLANNKDWLAENVRQQGFPAMCRDTATRDFVRSLGIEAEFGGCISQTLPRYGGPRSGHLVLDDLTIPTARRDMRVTQLQRRLMDMPAAQRLELAAERIELLKKAATVETSRLHVWLPCLAMGTPVRLMRSPAIPEMDRFSGYLSQI